MKKIKTGKGSAAVVLYALLMILLTLALSLLCAKLILSGVIGEEQASICGGLIVGLVSMLVGLISALRSPRRKLLWGLAAAAGYFLMLLLSNLLFFGISFSNVLLIAAWIMGGGILGSLLGRLKIRKYA